MSTPTVHEAEVLERFENAEQDPQTGVWRERVSGYRENSLFGTKVPSAAGRDGDQLGIKPGSPLPFVVEIGVGKDRELLPEVDLSKMDAAVVERVVRQYRGDPVAAFRELARIMQEDVVIEDSGGDIPEPVVPRRAAPVARPPASNPAQVFRKKAGESVEARARRLRSELSAVEDELEAKAAAARVPVQVEAPRPEPTQRAEAPVMRAAQEAQAVAPEVQVEFILPQGGSVTTYYHEVIAQPGIVVFVYDTRFRFGTRYTPPVLEDVITAVVTGQRTIQVPVLSAGIKYQHGVYEYTVMPVYNEPQE